MSSKQTIDFAGEAVQASPSFMAAVKHANRRPNSVSVFSPTDDDAHMVINKNHPDLERFISIAIDASSIRGREHLVHIVLPKCDDVFSYIFNASGSQSESSFPPATEAFLPIQGRALDLA